jgi:preprotein translocase subunit SecD
LGLDLKGGVHLTLGVDVDNSLAKNLGQMGEDVRSKARERGLLVLKPKVLSKEKLEVVLLRPDQKNKLEELLEQEYEQFIVSDAGMMEGGKLRYELTLQEQMQEYIKGLTMDQAVKTIRNRIDEFGVAEPDIRRQQDNRIQIQLPGMDDPERAMDLIIQVAHLEFKIVDEKADLEKAQNGILPPESELSTIMHRNLDGSYIERPIVLKKEALLTGEYIVDAHTNFDTYNVPYVSLTFNTRGARLFARVTGENVQKRLAIVLDGKVYSAPVIQDKISGGRASITGRFSIEEAHDLAVTLRAGALPAPITVLEERSIGPSLGQESIDKGVYSAALGALIVIVFMVVYYGFAGFVADVVLILNVMLIMAGLSAFGGVLTLPGIAGIILTIGMAVDANVIIFERIREELRNGLTAKAAIEEGYARATLTILDANVTTFIAALILFQFGTGPIRGFALTLCLGIVTSMFTAIFVSRIIFDLWAGGKPAEAKLSV